MILGVIYIGDRETGKTSLVLELANPKSNHVKVTYPDYEQLKSTLYDDSEGKTKSTGTLAGTKSIVDKGLQIEVDLPTGKKPITLDWLDTPGEIWRSSWQSVNPQEWREFLDTIVQTDGILVVLPPYREIIKVGDPDEFITQEQWCRRFERWVEFFRYQCPKIRHLLLCLNKADLFCDIQAEANQLAYIPNRSRMNWQQRDAYVYQRYFRPVHAQIQEINKNVSGLSVRCFITTIANRYLLELPWIYLGSYLAK